MIKFSHAHTHTKKKKTLYIESKSWFLLGGGAQHFILRSVKGVGEATFCAISFGAGKA